MEDKSNLVDTAIREPTAKRRRELPVNLKNDIAAAAAAVVLRVGGPPADALDLSSDLPPIDFSLASKQTHWDEHPQSIPCTPLLSPSGSPTLAPTAVTRSSFLPDLELEAGITPTESPPSDDVDFKPFSALSRETSTDESRSILSRIPSPLPMESQPPSPSLAPSRPPSRPSSTPSSRKTTPPVSPLSLGKSSNKELKTIPVISIPSAAKRPRSEDAEDFRKQQEVTPRALSAQTKPLAEGEVVALVQDHTTEPEAPLDASWKDVKYPPNGDPPNSEHEDPRKVQLVQVMIERCLFQYLTKAECAAVLNSHYSIPPGFVCLIWEELARQNPVFFTLYAMRLRIRDQLAGVNFLVRTQVHLQQKILEAHKKDQPPAQFAPVGVVAGGNGPTGKMTGQLVLPIKPKGPSTDKFEVLPSPSTPRMAISSAALPTIVPPTANTTPAYSVHPAHPGINQSMRVDDKPLPKPLSKLPRLSLNLSRPEVPIPSMQNLLTPPVRNGGINLNNLPEPRTYRGLMTPVDATTPMHIFTPEGMEHEETPSPEAEIRIPEAPKVPTPEPSADSYAPTDQSVPFTPNVDQSYFLSMPSEPLFDSGSANSSSDWLGPPPTPAGYLPPLTPGLSNQLGPLFGSSPYVPAGLTPYTPQPDHGHVYPPALSPGQSDSETKLPPLFGSYPKMDNFSDPSDFLSYNSVSNTFPESLRTSDELLASFEGDKPESYTPSTSSRREARKRRALMANGNFDSFEMNPSTMSQSWGSEQIIPTYNIEADKLPPLDQPWSLS